MHRAACALLGEHDFSAFRAAGCQARSPNRKVLSIEVTREDDWVCLAISANAFLQHMVRNITGTLVRVGSGDADESWVATVLAGRDRRAPALPRRRTDLPSCGSTTRRTLVCRRWLRTMHRDIMSP